MNKTESKLWDELFDNPIFIASNKLIRQLKAAGCLVGGMADGLLITLPDGQWLSRPVNSMEAIDKLRADVLALIPTRKGMQ